MIISQSKILFKITSMSPHRSSHPNDFLVFPSPNTWRITKLYKYDVTSISSPLSVFLHKLARQSLTCVQTSLCHKVNITFPLGITPMSPLSSQEPHVQQVFCCKHNTHHCPVCLWFSVFSENT